MGTNLDPDQLKAVAVEKNTVVTAGAGSGKTTVLAHRFVHLLRTGRAEVDGILTLTFTRKAAAEMYERIYHLLLEQSETAPSGGERSRLREALKGFEKAAISTLDSFCAGIVRGGSSRFGIAGDFRQDEFATASLIGEQALQFLLEKSTNPSLRHFLEEYGVEAVLDRLLLPLAREEFHMAAEDPLEEMFDRQIAYLRFQAGEIASRLQEVRRWFLEEDLPKDRKSLMNAREALQRIGNPVDVLQAEDWTALLEIGETKLRSPGNAKHPLILEGKDRIALWKEGAAQLAPIAGLFQSEETYRGMYRLLTDYQGRIADIKRANGILTFRDVVEMAVTLLREEPDLRAHYKNRFTHIMIDEFQDNNDLQRQLLFLLAERDELNSPGIPSPYQLKADKLFFVGDEKQSIYKFRGADVRVLKQLQQQIRASGGKSLQLPRNYRSHSELIVFFNKLFSRVMGKGANASDTTDRGPCGSIGSIGSISTGGEGIAGGAGDSVSGSERGDFEAEFVPLEAPGEDTGFSPAIHLLYQPHRSGTYTEGEEGAAEQVVEGPGEQFSEEILLSAAEAEAWAVAKFIRERVGTGSLMVRNGKDEQGKPRSRQASYDDVAILMRSSSNQIHLEKFLRRLQIPYTVQSIRSLFQDAPVNDMYQMLQLLVYPGDLTAYAALLRSPFAHLSDDLVCRIILETRARQGQAFSHHGEEDVFREQGEREKYLQAHKLYHELRGKAVNSPLAELVRHLWYEGGYRYVVLRDPDYHLYLEFYDALSALARLNDSRGRNLALFLDFLRDNLGDYKKMEDLELIPRSKRGVQLLSIHKSKGLEFPVVILADMGNTGSGGQKNLFFRDEEFGLVFDIHEKNGNGTKNRRNYFSEAAAKRQKREEAAELKRLLYVGCTRAEEHLVLAGSHHSKNRKIDKEEGQKALLNLVLEAFGWDGESSVPDMGRTLGCDIQEIPELTTDEVKGWSRRSKSRPVDQVPGKMGEAPLIRREVLQREWNATELNLLYQEMRGERGSEFGLEKSRPPGGHDSSAGHDALAASISPGGHDSSAGRRLLSISPSEALEKLDPLLRGNAAAMAFGDLVHQTIEFEVKELPGKPDLPAAFLELEPDSVKLLLDGARAVAERFFATPLGEEVRAAAGEGMVEAELPFLLRLDNAGPNEKTGPNGPDAASRANGLNGAGGPDGSVERREGAGPAGKKGPGDYHLVRGQIDLLLQRDDEVVVVDFKTDRTPHPAAYEVQMAVYREAAAELYGKPARSILVYVRGGELHEVDTAVDLKGLVAWQQDRATVLRREPSPGGEEESPF